MVMNSFLKVCHPFKCFSQILSRSRTLLKTKIPATKYILITGGGTNDKEVIACSIGKILESNGCKVTSIKLHPYLNTHVKHELPEGISITAGKIYRDIINRERRGDFLGKTVQVVPHVTDYVQKWVERVVQKPVSNDKRPEICIIQLEGTIGDIGLLPFLEALRQLQFRLKKENFIVVHLNLLPQFKEPSEYEEKSIQNSVTELKGLGLSPDLVVSRLNTFNEEYHYQMISNFCHVPPELPKATENEANTAQDNVKEFDLSPDLVKIPKMKYILVTGGVISGIGKGVIASSIGKILKNNGFEVTVIKIDPYLNPDAGTFSPIEHGEVFVLNDGAETDVDLGNYERTLNIKLHRDNSITSGKILQGVIDMAESVDFLGKKVQVDPHVTDYLQRWIERVAQKSVSNDKQPEICIIELGGTIGEIEGLPFVKALSLFQSRLKKEDFLSVHLTYVLQPKAIGEHKTKPTQESVRNLRRLGLSPDLLVCRSDNHVEENVKQKVSNFCHLPPQQVICLHDLKSVYHVPIFLEKHGLVGFFHERLNLPIRHPDCLINAQKSSQEWHKLVMKIDNLVTEVKIALIGKYTASKESYTSVIEALQHASMMCNLKLNLQFIAAVDLEKETKQTNAFRYNKAWVDLHKADGIIVPGGFGTRGFEGKITAIGWARKNKKPFLGICLGFQLAVVEFARNELGWKNAHTIEVAPKYTRDRKNVVIKMPEHHTGIMGETMRLGKKSTLFRTQRKEKSILWHLYGKQDFIEERHRHRYEVNRTYVDDLEKAGINFVAHDEKEERLEILELPDHPYFVGVQFHPEFLSYPLRPSPPFLGLILAASNRLQSYLAQGCQAIEEAEISDKEDIAEAI